MTKANRLHTVKIYRWRFYGVLVVLAAIGIALVVHLIKLQVLPDAHRGFEFLQDQGLSRTLRVEEIPAHRGVITDRYGEPLAVSTPVVSLWANPKELSLVEDKQLALLAKSLDVKLTHLQERLQRYQRKEFMYIRRQLSPKQAEKILALNVKGLYGKNEYKRFYPAGEVTAHLVGFTNIDDKGQEGLELAYEQWLAGSSGSKQVLKDLAGRLIKDVALLQPPSSGKDVALSIDLRLQYLAYKELKATVKAHGAESGSVVLLDAYTGEILAMVNQPSFNPNNRSQLQAGALRNRAMTDQFEPGSTMKPLTIMSALESGRYSIDSTIDTHPGFFRVGRKTLLDPVNYGVMDLTKIITKSSQVGLTKISLDLDANDIRDMYFRVGLGQSTGTGFPGESVGLLPNYPKWQPIVQANFSFGYGVTLTPLQLAQAYSVIANRGVKKPVSLLKQSETSEQTQVVATNVAEDMVGMLKTVVQTGGTATRANLKHYTVAGKTGTIHKVGKGGYADDRYISLFAGFAPANNPRIVAVAVIHEPSKGQYFGGEVAAPLFAKVVERSLQLMQVPPEEHRLQDDKNKFPEQFHTVSQHPDVEKLRAPKHGEPVT